MRNAGSFCLVALSTALLGCWGGPESPRTIAARAAITAFLSELASGKTNAAYAKTSPGFRNTMDRAAFGDYLRRNAALVHHEHRSYGPFVSEIQGRDGVWWVELTVILSGPNGGGDYTIRAIESPQGWEIESLQPSLVR